jgi:hypothetical protein
MLDFTKKVQIRDWVSNCVLETVSPEDGLLMMFRSARYDGNHATANVRTLHPHDAKVVGALDIQAIVFTQDA